MRAPIRSAAALGAGNLISGNGGPGISILGPTNVVQGNFIGITPAGTPVPNIGDGILIQGASNNTIGGMNAGDRNFVSANSGAGVRIMGAADGTMASNNIVQGNDIGTNTAGMPSSMPPLGNTDGVSLQGGAYNNTIGDGALASDPALGTTIQTTRPPTLLPGISTTAS